MTEAARRKKGVLLTIGEAPEAEPGIGQKGQSAEREKYVRAVGRGIRSTCCCDGPREGRLGRTVRNGQAPSADTAGCKQEQSRSHRGTGRPPAGAGCSYMYSRVLVAGLVTTSRARATAKKEADPRPSRNVTTDSPGRRMCRYWAVKSKVRMSNPDLWVAPLLIWRRQRRRGAALRATG